MDEDKTLKTLSWEKIYEIWLGEMTGLNAPINPLVHQIDIFDPENPAGRKEKAVWWVREPKKITLKHAGWQKFFYDHPGASGDVGMYPNPGINDTCYMLCENRDSLEKMAAVLIAASFYEDRGSNHIYLHNHNVLYDYWHIVLDVFGKKGCPWSGNCKYTLPGNNNSRIFHGDPPGDLRDLTRWYAFEHNLILQELTPVAVLFKDRPNPFIDKIVRDYIEKQRKEYEEWEVRREEERKEAQRIEEAQLAKHPRWRQWASLSPKELKELVWSKPTVEIAADFGVSDVAIAKRCKTLGIAKPPVGFWRKVETGYLPHPKGKPVPQKKGPSQ